MTAALSLVPAKSFDRDLITYIDCDTLLILYLCHFLYISFEFDVLSVIIAAARCITCCCLFIPRTRCVTIGLRQLDLIELLMVFPDVFSTDSSQSSTLQRDQYDRDDPYLLAACSECN